MYIQEQKHTYSQGKKSPVSDRAKGTDTDHGTQKYQPKNKWISSKDFFQPSLLGSGAGGHPQCHTPVRPARTGRAQLRAPSQGTQRTRWVQGAAGNGGCRAHGFIGLHGAARCSVSVPAPGDSATARRHGHKAGPYGENLAPEYPAVRYPGLLRALE